MARRKDTPIETFVVFVRPEHSRLSQARPVFFVKARSISEALRAGREEMIERMGRDHYALGAGPISDPSNESGPQARAVNREAFGIPGDDWFVSERAELKSMLGSFAEGEIQHCPEPTRFFKVGDKLAGGGEHVVLRVFEGGKFYLTRHTYTDQSVHSRTKGEEIVDERARPWYDCFPKGSFPKSQRRVGDDFLGGVSQSLQSTWSTVYFMVLNQGVNMDPIYQRDHVWSLEDKQKLIDALLHRREVGTFVFRRIPLKESLRTGYDTEIVDGKQRLTAVIDYFLGKFPVHGLHYHELNPEDRYTLEGNMFRYSIINAEVPLAKVIEMFVMLNVTGKPMDPAVIEKAKSLLTELKDER